MKTAGIIGGHDFLGCDITLKFLSENYRVKVLIPESSKNKKPVITTGLKPGENLIYCHINMEDTSQLEIFLKDCDCLIHCGLPYEIGEYSGEGTIYVPVINKSGNLLKCIHNIPNLGKVLFFTSVAVYNFFDSGLPSAIYHQENSESVVKSKSVEKAFYHSEKIIDKVLNDMPDDQVGVIVVSPVLSLKNMLLNSRETTLEGLHYMFRNKIEHDRVFQKLIKRKLVKTMVNVNELPDIVFDTIKNYDNYKIKSSSSKTYHSDI